MNEHMENEFSDCEEEENRSEESEEEEQGTRPVLLEKPGTKLAVWNFFLHQK